MIFLTVGHQSPFDRLVRLVDDWAREHPRQRVCAQIGAGDYVPQHVQWTRWLAPDAFDGHIDAADAVVAHAGTGVIIQVLLRRKPLLVMPRLAALGETRNDHQTGTARHFSSQGQIQAAFDDHELRAKLTCIHQHACGTGLGREASPELLLRLRRFLEAEEVCVNGRTRAT